MNKRQLARWIPLFLISIMFISFTQELAAKQKLTVILDWFANPNHAPLFVAKQKGFFEKEGLEVEIITPADPSDPPKWLALRRGDIAIDYQPHAILQRARGLPIKQIGTLIDQPLNCLVVLASSPINTLAELRGKEVAYSTPEIDLLILKAMLQTANLTLNDIIPINVHYDLTQALLSKKVSAAIGMMRNVELIQLEGLGHKGRAFFPEKNGVPPYSELVFIAHSKKANDDRFNHFFLALNRARDYLLAHEEESWQLFVSVHPELNTPINKKIWLNTLPYFKGNFANVNQAQCEALVTFFGKDNQTKFDKNFCHGFLISKDVIKTNKY